MLTKTESELFAIARDVLIGAGASVENAEIVAEHLSLANLSGVDTHGVWHLPGYVDHLRKGLIDGKAVPSVIQRSHNSALVTGNWTFGQVAARYATELAIDLATDNDMAVVGLVQSHHIGRLGHFSEMAAGAGFVAQVWAGGYSEEAPAMMPYGGRKPLLHTNPISMAFPAGQEPRFMFDFATTVVAGVKIENARARGESLPPGVIVNSQGLPTTDPSDFFRGGGHVAFGGHKGYAISYAAEFFGRLLTGSTRFADTNRAGPALRNQGVTFILMRPDLFRTRSDYEQDADEMEQRTRAIPPAPGYQGVLVPGDPEVRARTERRKSGIAIEEGLWQKLEALRGRNAKPDAALHA